ncbi:MAG: hypothetical protein ACLGIC_09275 [Acidimicrobiia bacterium]
MRTAVAALVLAALLASGCSNGSGAADAAGLTSLLLTDRAVAEVLPDLRPATEGADGGDHARLDPALLADGPLAGGEQAVVRQWAAPFSSDHDDPVVPMVISVTSMVVAMPDGDAAQAGVERLLDLVGAEGARSVPHDRFEAALTPADDGGGVAAVGAAVAGDRVVTVQVDGAERIDPRSLTQILDRAADQLP